MELGSSANFVPVDGNFDGDLFLAKTLKNGSWIAPWGNLHGHLTLEPMTINSPLKNFDLSPSEVPFRRMERVVSIMAGMVAVVIRW